MKRISPHKLPNTSLQSYKYVFSVSEKPSMASSSSHSLMHAPSEAHTINAWFSYIVIDLSTLLLSFYQL